MYKIDNDNFYAYIFILTFVFPEIPTFISLSAFRFPSTEFPDSATEFRLLGIAKFSNIIKHFFRIFKIRFFYSRNFNKRYLFVYLYFNLYDFI